MAEYDINDLKDKLNVAVITIRNDEYEAFCGAVGAEHTLLNGKKNTVYKYATVTAQTGFEFHIAILRTGEQGNEEAQAVTSNIYFDFDPKWIFLVGIGGGFPQEEFTLGDVYLATRYHNLSVRSVSDGQQERYRGGGGPMKRYWVSLASNIAGVSHRFSGWDGIESIGRERPDISVPSGPDAPIYYGDDQDRLATHQHISTHFGNGSKRQKPKVVSGGVFSANTLLKDTKLAREWKNIAKGAEAVEMELTGIMKAVEATGNDNEVVVCIRGISDIVGLHRDEMWTDYACRTAASFAYRLLESGVLESRLPLDQLASEGLITEDTQSDTWVSDISKFASDLQYLPDVSFETGIRIYSTCLWELTTLSEDLAESLNARAENFLQALATFVVDRKERLPVFGTPGSGKTTLLSLVAVLLRRRFRKEGVDAESEYINLHDYDELFDTDHTVTRRLIHDRIKKDLEKISELAARNELYLFIDGYDLHGRDKIDFQDYFIERVQRIEGVHILGVGEPDDSDRISPCIDEQNHPNFLNRKDSFLLMRSVPVDQSQLLCCTFENLHEFLRRHATSSLQIGSVKIFDRVRQSGLRRVDLLRLDIIGSATTKETPREFPDCISSYIRGYLWNAVMERRRLVRSHPAEPLELETLNQAVETELRRAAKYIYDHDVHDIDDKETRASIVCWGLLTGHVAVRSFCQAYHIVTTLEKIGRDLGRTEPTQEQADSAIVLWRKAKLNGQLFPDEVNAACKWLINGSRSTFVFNAVTTIVAQRSRSAPPHVGKKRSESYNVEKVASEIDFTHLCYLLGRFTGHLSSAKRILRDLHSRYIQHSTIISFLQHEEADLFEHDGIQDEDDAAMAKLRMLQCTLLISRIMIESGRTQSRLSGEFLEHMRNSAWRDMTCGFHLEYYGDEQFHYDVTTHMPDEKDTLASQRRTLDAMLPRLKDAIKKDSPHSLFDVEMATVCALANTRQQSLEVWDEESMECRQRLRGLLGIKAKRGSGKKIRNRPVYSYMKFTSRYIHRDYQTSPFAFVTKLYELKYSTPRSGWPLKLGLKGRIESVAAHTFGAMLLAECLLPDNAPRNLPGYDKAQVIRNLLVHDVSESITGDRPSDGAGQQPRGPQRGQEKQIARMLSWLGTLRGVLGFKSLANHWAETEDAEKINGKLAMLFDKLDPMFQMVVYRKHYSDQVNADWDEFFELLKGEAVEVSEDLPVFEVLASHWIEWANEEYYRDREWLTHEELFAGTSKYFPWEGRGKDKGGEVILTPGKRDIKVWFDHVTEVLH